MATILWWVVLLRGMATEISYLGSRVVPWVIAVQLVTLVAFVGALVASVWNARLVWRSERSRWAKAWSAVLVVASVTLVWVGIAFNLIGFDRNF
jgi:hypothetical protein